MSTYVPEISAGARPVSIRREVFGLLALVDLSNPARRLLDVLLSLYNEETGVAEISQREMAAALGTAVPAVNRAVQQLRETGLAWQIEDGHYQLHPLLTGGAVASPAVSVPEIKAVQPAAFTEQRRERYTAQIANLGQLAASA